MALGCKSTIHRKLNRWLIESTEENLDAVYERDKGDPIYILCLRNLISNHATIAHIVDQPGEPQI